MSHFVQGVLTISEETYIGEPDLRLASGQTIRLLYYNLGSRGGYKKEPLLSLLLEENKWYELLLLVHIGIRVGTITLAPAVPPGTEMELKSLALLPRFPTIRHNWVLQGIVLDTQWDAASQSYLAFNGPVVFTHHWVLIQTAIGKMVLSYRDLKKGLGEQAEHLAPGTYLEWSPARLDILAIIDPEPGE